MKLPFDVSNRQIEAPVEQLGGLAGKRVLIVDDNATNRMICRRSLERAGCEIREAQDGRAALDEVTKEQPCVILMDVMMPVMDGLECTRRLKANPETQDIPIIIVSARADPKSLSSESTQARFVSAVAISPLLPWSLASSTHRLKTCRALGAWPPK